MPNMMILAMIGRVSISKPYWIHIVRFSLNEIGRISVFNRNIKEYEKSKHMLVEKELQEQN